LKFFNIYTGVLFFLIVSETFSLQNDSLTIRYNFINSEPQNADVYLNDTYIGRTPVHFTWEKDNINRKITVKLEGYAVYNYILSDEEENINKTFKLIPLSGFRDKEIVFKDKSYHFSKPVKLVPVLISSVVTAASAVMAYYFKSLAIEKNDKYEQTGDPALLDEKKQYDLTGGLSLMVFQIGFCFLIYYFFIDN